MVARKVPFSDDLVTNPMIWGFAPIYWNTGFCYKTQFLFLSDICAYLFLGYIVWYGFFTLLLNFHALYTCQYIHILVLLKPSLTRPFHSSFQVSSQNGRLSGLKRLWTPHQTLNSLLKSTLGLSNRFVFYTDSKKLACQCLSL